MFNPDKPIKSHKEDILGRYPFAQSLGDAILGYKEKDSIAIGLFGTWGSGKTSIINMALEHIDDLISKKQTNDKKPIIIRFNPWNYSDQSQLITQFFRQLSVVLRRHDYASDAKEAGKLLEAYAKFLELASLVPVIGPHVGILSKVFKKTASATKGWGDLKSNDLNSIRSELNELLEKQPYKIIIVIDDVDRLNDTEIRQIFQLIKSLGDFPNTIYLLAFDRNVVINALKKLQKGSGAEYLEKVVQIPFEIPLISKQEVEHLLFSQLDELIRDIPESKWNKVHWNNIYHSGLKYFFKNIRDVIRYVNSLRFSFEMVNGEVNVIDFFAITGIQVFIPEVYYGIRDNKDIFLGIYYPNYENNDAKQYKKRCDEIISRVNEPPQEFLKDFLKMLFPKLRSIYSNSDYDYSVPDNWRKDCRICSPDIFDIFFRLSLSKGEISQGEIETILSLGNDPDLFAEALLKLNEDGRIIMFLERLEDYTGSDIPEGNIEPIVAVLMDIGDLFPEGDSGFLAMGTPMRLFRLFYQLSYRFDGYERRFNIFKSVMEKTTRSLYTIVHAVRVQDQLHDEKTQVSDEKLIVNSKQLEELKKLACNKIESWAADGRLMKHRHLPSILSIWKGWGKGDKTNVFVNNMIENDDGLIEFIASFLSKSTSQGISEIPWRINLKSVEEFVNLQKAESRIRKKFSSSGFEQFDDRKKLAIRTFLDTIDGKTTEHFKNAT